MAFTEHKEHKATIEARKHEVFQLRLKGKSFRAIGAELGVSHAQAFADYKDVMDELKASTMESAEQQRRIDLERLDALLAGLAERAMSGLEERATEAYLKVLDRRAKLLGLDAPDKHEIAEVSATPERAADAVRRAFGQHATPEAAPVQGDASEVSSEPAEP